MILNEVEGFPCVSIDYFQAMYDAVDYTISKGYQYLIFLCPALKHEAEKNVFALKQRHRGFMAALKKYSDRDIGYEMVDNMHVISELPFQASLNKVKTAILCSSDVYAIVF
jgi:LacI family transcriptional regulator